MVGACGDCIESWGPGAWCCGAVVADSFLSALAAVRAKIRHVSRCSLDNMTFTHSTFVA